MRLRGLKCVVTGGASGIGAATARRFVAEGARVCILDRDVSTAEALTDELGADHFALALDVRLEAQVEHAVANVHERWGHIDVLVNNAGAELNKTYDETTVDEWDKVLDTDLKGPWLLCKHFVPRMVERGSGSVINVASLNGLVGFPLSTAYGSAKGGWLSLPAIWLSSLRAAGADQLRVPRRDRNADDGALDRLDAR